ncbi:MAG: glycosyltransferase [Oscillospiraceae bacterium]
MLEETGPWPFHLLTEDIQFSVDQVTRGRKIAFCPDAVLYDEQPTTFRQSWNQRLRWSKGICRYSGATAPSCCGARPGGASPATTWRRPLCRPSSCRPRPSSAT